MKRFVAALLLALVACTASAPSPTPSPSVSIQQSPTPTPSRSTPVAAMFDARRVLTDIRTLTIGIGTRLAASPGYNAAAAFTAKRFQSLGYRVVRQRVPIPAGSSEGVTVSAGSGDNVIAYPPGYDPAAPHLLVGGHLDTVARTRGANDNGSGAAAVLELARLARLGATRLPIVFAEWIGEERRFKGAEGALFGSRFYLSNLATAERRALRGVMNVDMIGNGSIVRVCHNSGAFDRRFLDATIRAARRLNAPHREEVISAFISDHLPFQRAGIPVSWVWAGEHPTVHTPGDTVAVIRAADVERIGRVAWETLRTFAG
jgi:Zn-dependent M28 family amino/carboxypeptidase